MDDPLELLQHLLMTGLFAAALCVASVVAAGAIVFVVWVLARASRGVAAVVHRVRAEAPQRERRELAVPVLRRLRRP